MSKQNTRNYKFIFEATIGKLSIAIKFPCQIKLSWKRSNEVAQIEPCSLENGCINFDRKISLPVNMYYDENLQKFLEKKSVFSLILITPKGEKSAGIVTLDLANMLNQKIAEFENVYPLEKCPVPNSSLQIHINSYAVAVQDIDSLSQITGAQQMIFGNSQLPTTVNDSYSELGESMVKKQDSDVKTDKYETTDVISYSVSTSGFIDNITKMNDVAAKISNFALNVSDKLRSEMAKLRQKNKSLTIELDDQRKKNQILDQELSRLRVNQDNLRSQAEVIHSISQLKQQQYARNLDQLSQKLVRVQQQLEITENMKRALENSSMSNDSEKMQYINSLKAENQQNLIRFNEEKERLQQALQQERDSTYALKSTNANLMNELKSLQDQQSNLNAFKRNLELERASNQKEIEEARIRLEKVYSEMVTAFRDVIM